MNEAESTPSPSRFWSRLGIRNAALKAPAAGDVPRKWANTCSRTSPAIRDNRIPEATSREWNPVDRERVTRRGYPEWWGKRSKSESQATSGREIRPPERQRRAPNQPGATPQETATRNHREGRRSAPSVRGKPGQRPTNPRPARDVVT